MALPTKYFGLVLNWNDDDRSGLPRTDLFSPAHVFNPYIFTEDGAVCCCRVCEPQLWQFEPLPNSFDAWLPVEPPRARNGCPWGDLDAEYRARIAEFTPL